MRFIDILDLGLSAANAAASASAAGTLSDMQEQAEQQRIQRERTLARRDRIFRIKQLLEDTLRLEQQSPLAAASH